MIPTSTDGTCPFKRDAEHDCTGGRVTGHNAMVICNWVGKTADEDRRRCSRFYAEAALAEIKPEKFCCKQMENVWHECAETSGFMAGGFDLLKQVNDRIFVWRNFERVQFTFCPFCGERLIHEQPAK